VKDIAEALVGPDTPVRAVIEVINRTAIQIALVVDGTQRLLGTVSDGDVRRAILAGRPIDVPASTIMNPNPVTIDLGTAREDALFLMRDRNIHQIPVLDGAGRVVSIELINDLIAPDFSDRTVVILAGGMGTRLRPLTNDRPKPMVKVGDRPVLESMIISLREHGFTDITLCVNYLSEMIENHFGDGSELGVGIRYIHEEKRLGTAGALTLLPERPRRPILVMNADLLTRVHFGQLVRFHDQMHSHATMCVREYSIRVPYGVVRTDDHKVIGIDEKPVERFMVNAGIYVLAPSVIDLVPPNEHFDMPTLLERIREAGHQTAAFPLHEYWIDIGAKGDLQQAENDFHEHFRL